MTGLGLNGAIPSGELTATFKGGWLRHFRLVLSSAGGAAAAIAAMALLGKQPAEGFKLLAQWGPWPVIALVALILVGGFMSRMNDTVSTTFAAVVNSAERQAEASGKTADALTRLADQGGRQAEEVRRLAIFNAQEFPGIYIRFDKQDDVLQRQNEVLQQLHGAVKELVDRGRNDH
jgi:hypothetical protein